MLDLVPDLRGWLGGGARVALARVVDLDGSGPRLPGAAMAISDDGRVAGSVSGGCIESAVVTDALDVLDGGAARLVRFGYSDDDAVAVGLTCGGTVHVFIEVVTASRWAAIERIAAAVAEDRPAAVATVVAGPGAGAWVDLAGDRAGDRAVPADATAERAQAGAAWAGSLGDPGLDRVVRRDVIGEMASGRSGVRRYGSSGEAGADDVAVFIETFAPPPRMIIFGAIDFTAALARLRKEHPTFRRSRFFDGRPVKMEEGDNIPDVVWLRPDGTLMQPEDWDSGFGRAVGVFLNGQGIRERDRRGEAISDDHFLVLFNAGDEPVDFHVPDLEYSPEWDVYVDTAGERANTEPILPGEALQLEPKSLIVLREHHLPEPEIDHTVAASLTAQIAITATDDLPGQEEPARVAWTRALDSARRQTSDHPDNPGWAMRRGIYAARAGQASEALEASMRAVTLAPGDPEVLYYAALSQSLVGAPAAARQLLGQALAKGFPAEMAAQEPTLKPLLPAPKATRPAARP